MEACAGRDATVVCCYTPKPFAKIGPKNAVALLRPVLDM